jgi:hypothetical protein
MNLSPAKDELSAVLPLFPLEITGVTGQLYYDGRRKV